MSGCNAHARLAAEILAVLGELSPSLESSRERSWASATFLGARHRYRIVVAGRDLNRLDSLMLSLRRREYSTFGHIVVDVHTEIELAESGGVLTVEASTVEDC